ncbi:hypothetical protein R1sor_006252 [Riccia sorocarpa]|uniref:Exostosin GT47 domain-containing protein n=1 Tax=Riccia sorocarpa TaxID=122646 RepID=A0ABD3HP52_9MARC
MTEGLVKHVSSVSYYSRENRRLVVTIVVCITSVLALISFYQSCTSCDSAWTSLNILGSRTSFLASPLRAQQEGGPSETILATSFSSPAPSTVSHEISSISNISNPSSGSEEECVSSNVSHASSEVLKNSEDVRGKEDAVSSTYNDSKKTEADEDDIREQVDSSPASADNHLLMAMDLEKVFPNSSKLELELLAAKLMIEDATAEDADQTLYAPSYVDVAAFSLSYKLMENLFRVYTYKDGNSSFLRAGPLTGIYATEGQFITKLMHSRFIQEDPLNAHMFFLPYSVAEMVDTLYVEDSYDMSPLTDFVRGYVNTIAQNYPFWNRTQGSDHFFVSCHDWGPATAREHKQLNTNAVKVVCNANSSEEFVLGRDASLPEIYLHSKPLEVGGPPASSRAILAFFAGQMHGHVRPILLKHWADKDPQMKVFEHVPPTNRSGVLEYILHMKHSKYCLCPAGYEVNSPRIVEAIYYDCVPVIIADNFILPFSDVLNWSTFSVTVPEAEIPNLKDILLGIPEKSYRTMQRRLSKIRQHFMWHHKPVKYDAFHMILHSVWMSRLNNIHP